jgi:hypothetical protein
MFTGKALPLAQATLDGVSTDTGIGLPALWAVMTVETRGCGFLDDRRPQILFERHVFHARTGGRFDAAAPDISNPSPGGYGAGGAAQYDRLARAMDLDRAAALESASWGLGQVMGFNARPAGFGGVEAMVQAMCESEDRQFEAMLAFIEANGLARPLVAGDWSAFARGYNGPDFTRDNYDGKLAQSWARYAVGPLPDLGVRAAQLHLRYLGYNPGVVDGWFGTNTQRALARFQAEHGLEAMPGHLDDETSAALLAAVEAIARPEPVPLEP